MKRFLYPLLCLALLPVAARAADAPAAFPAKAPAAVPFSWTGGYLGLHAGWMFGRSAGQMQDFPEISFMLPAPLAMNPSGFIGGVQWGYNYQIGNTVLGFESDLSGLAGAKAGATTTTLTVDGPQPATANTQLTWFGTTRARLGYAATPNWLLYGTAGLAYGGVDLDSTITLPITGVTFSGSRSKVHVGWTAGLGAEYAFGGNWSAKLEYLYYNLRGGTVVGFPDGLFINKTMTTLDLTGHIVRVGLNYRYNPGPWEPPAPAMYTKAPVMALDPAWEVGLRFWYSSGRTSKDLFDTTGALLISRLTYSGLDALSGETFARWNHTSGVFVKGYLGIGAITKGNLQDEDFPPVTVPYSSTNSEIRNSAIFYGAIDVGYNFLRGPGYSLGAFVGYHYYDEQLNAYGCAQTGGAGSGICVPSIGTGVLAISNDGKWQSVRLGLNGQIMITDRLKLTADAAWLPYTRLDSADTHWLRTLNNPPSPGFFTGPIPEDGTGNSGYQLEAVLSYAVTPNFNIGIGGRYWKMSTKGLTHFETAVFPPGAFAAQVLTFQTERYGVFAQGSVRF